MPKHILQGTVVSAPQNKTVSVLVERRIKHPVYAKTIRRSKKYAAHDPENRFAVGDQIRIIEHAPISKTKRWHVVYDAA